MRPDRCSLLADLCVNPANPISWIVVVNIVDVNINAQRFNAGIVGAHNHFVRIVLNTVFKRNDVSIGKGDQCNASVSAGWTSDFNRILSIVHAAVDNKLFVSPVVVG